MTVVIASTLIFFLSCLSVFAVDNLSVLFDGKFPDELKGDIDINPLQRVLPPMWNDIASLDIRYFSKDKNGAFIVDVWDYTGRMALYKHLIENVNHCSWESDKKATTSQKLNNNLHLGNIIWGLPLQHGWQFSSGRLLTQNGSTVLTPQSWWADMNYYLSVIPYLGAVEAGMAPKISVAHNPDTVRFCDNASACPDVVKPWTDFFLLVKSTQDQCSTTETFSTPGALDQSSSFFPIASRADFNLTYTMESLLQSLWNAHIHSIGTGLPLFEDELNNMSVPEAEFGRSWAGLVDLIAESLFPCNNTITNLLQNCLPQRILSDSDVAPHIENMSRLENRAVWLIDEIYRLNTATKGFVEDTWVKMMCTEPGRALGRKMLAFGMYRPALLAEYTLDLLRLVKNTPADTICGVLPNSKPQ